MSCGGGRRLPSKPFDDKELLKVVAEAISNRPNVQ
jgi:hypothetical protein